MSVSIPPSSLTGRLTLLFVALSIGAWVVARSAPLRAQRSAHTTESIAGRLAAGGEVLVRFRSNANATPTGVDRDTDADEDRPVGHGEWRRLHSRSFSTQSLLGALASRPDVLEVEPNYIVHSTAIPNDPLFPQLWGLNNTTTPGADIGA